MRILFVLAILFTAGCEFGRDQPVYNIESVPILTGSGKTLSLDEVKTTIIRSAVNRGWTIKEEVPGDLVATISPRQHIAIVDIRYTEKYFSISYRDSTALRYNGSTIHRNYNKWVKALEQEIQRRIVVQ